MVTESNADYFDPYCPEPDFSLTELELAELEESADDLYVDEDVEEGEY